jgi:hypothetical protein
MQTQRTQRRTTNLEGAHSFADAKVANAKGLTTHRLCQMSDPELANACLGAVSQGSIRE